MERQSLIVIAAVFLITAMSAEAESISTYDEHDAYQGETYENPNAVKIVPKHYGRSFNSDKGINSQNKPSKHGKYGKYGDPNSPDNPYYLHSHPGTKKILRSAVVGPKLPLK